MPKDCCIFVPYKITMALKETIAFAGITNIASCAAFIIRLAQERYPLLLVSSPDNSMQDLAEQVLSHVPEATVEAMACAKDGCWEADIIVVVGDTSLNEAFLNKIKAVSTQKMVVGVWLGNMSHEEAFPNKDLVELLPHSKVVLVGYHEGAEKVYIDGAHEETVVTVSAMTKQLGLNPILKAVKT